MTSDSQELAECPVPLLDLGAQFAPLADDIRAAIEEVLSTQRFVMGPHVEQLERALAEYCGSSSVFGVSSGTDALLAALMALEVQPGDKIITSPYTFFSTAGAIARMRATPVFVDIDPLTYNIDAAALEAAAPREVRGIVPVHLFGQMADMETVMAAAQQHRLWVVEDAAQAIGAELKGRRAGSFGEVGCFSFFPSKNLGGMGDGGAVATGDSELAETLDILRNHGSRPKYFHSIVGGNFRLDAIQAAILLVKLPHLDDWTRQRQANATRYRRLFTEAGLATREGGHRGGLGEAPVVLPYEAPNRRHVYNQFVVRVRERDALRSYLQSKHIGCEVYYPLPLHLQKCFSYLGHQEGDFPEAELAARETLALPIYPELTAQQAERVVGVVDEFYHERQ